MLQEGSTSHFTLLPLLLAAVHCCEALFFFHSNMSNRIFKQKILFYYITFHVGDPECLAPRIMKRSRVIEIWIFLTLTFNFNLWLGYFSPCFMELAVRELKARSRISHVLHFPSSMTKINFYNKKLETDNRALVFIFCAKIAQLIEWPHWRHHVQKVEGLSLCLHVCGSTLPCTTALHLRVSNH